MIKHLEKNQTLDSILTEELTLVDFNATWCGPCQMFSETLDEYLENEEVNVIKIDIDDHENLAREYGVMVVPTIMLFNNKEKVKQKTGYMNKNELEEFIKN